MSTQMPDYNYIDDYEREWTQKFEGTYTPEEIELNKKLLEECMKETVDFTAVEELLKQGADPLGGTAVAGWNILNHVYNEIVTESHENDSVNLPAITELFLRYEMNVEAPRVPYDGENSLHPLWCYTFVANKNGIAALKLLLDHGLSAAGFAEFWDHSMFDFCNLDCGDPENDAFWNKEAIWTFKMMLFGATYDHILNDDEWGRGLKDVLCSSFNTTDIHIFRNWDDFEYHFDTSGCERFPEFYGSIVHIYSKTTGEEVWKLGVGLAGVALLKEQLERDSQSNDAGE